MNNKKVIVWGIALFCFFNSFTTYAAPYDTKTSASMPYIEYEVAEVPSLSPHQVVPSEDGLYAEGTVYYSTYVEKPPSYLYHSEVHNGKRYCGYLPLRIIEYSDNRTIAYYRGTIYAEILTLSLSPTVD